MDSICIYCGSSDEVQPKYYAAARQIGEVVAQHGLRLVYGGGSTGLMGALADATLAAGGEVVGVITEQFNTPRLAHNGLTHMEVLPTMHHRKARMVELADAFVALPGGLGTLEELFETLTWAQIGLHAKPIGLFNVDGYFDPLLAFLEQVREEGFMYAEHNNLYTHARQPHSLLDSLMNYQPPTGLARWVDRDS